MGRLNLMIQEPHKIEAGWEDLEISLERHEGLLGWLEEWPPEGRLFSPKVKRLHKELVEEVRQDMEQLAARRASALEALPKGYWDEPDIR